MCKDEAQLSVVIGAAPGPRDGVTGGLRHTAHQLKIPAPVIRQLSSIGEYILAHAKRVLRRKPPQDRDGWRKVSASGSS